MTTLSDDDINKMNCSNLRAECKKANLITTGLKADLQKRLRNHIQAHQNDNDNGKTADLQRNKENTSPAPAPAPAPTKKYQSADLFVCPITKELPLEPMVADDGFVYERKAIQKHISKAQAGALKSPVTKAPMGHHLIPAVHHKMQMETLIKNGDLEPVLVSKWNKRLKNRVTKKKAMEKLLKKADSGDAEAMYDVAGKYSRGEDGFQKDDKLAHSFYVKAHNAGYVTATAMVGSDLYRGSGVTRSSVKGRHYLGMAICNGSRFAAYLLGTVLAKGLCDTKVDTNEAIHWLLIAIVGDSPVHDMTQDGVEEAQKLLDELMKAAAESQSESN